MVWMILCIITTDFKNSLWPLVLVPDLRGTFQIDMHLVCYCQTKFICRCVECCLFSSLLFESLPSKPSQSIPVHFICWHKPCPSNVIWLSNMRTSLIHSWLVALNWNWSAGFWLWLSDRRVPYWHRYLNQKSWRSYFPVLQNNECDMHTHTLYSTLLIFWWLRDVMTPQSQ